MKKIKMFLMIALFSLVLGLSSCTGCNNEATPNETATDTTAIVTAVLNVENTIATDREAMYLKGGEYRWFESCILLSEYLDSANVTSDPVMVSNVFQRLVEKKDGNKKGYDTWVYKFQHLSDGTLLVDSVRGFWIEDNPLNEEKISLKYTEAYDKIMATNSPKPHSQQVCLRNPVGPVQCNAQYVFGNIHEQLWVDAVTGEVRNSNPAFPKEKGFKMPLGEWP